MKKWIALMLAVMSILTGFSGCQKTDVTGMVDFDDVTYPEIDNGLEDLLIKQIYNDDGLAYATVFYTPDGLVGGFYESEYNAEGAEIRRFLYDADCTLLAITGIGENGEDLGFEIADTKAEWKYYQFDENWNTIRTEYYEGQELVTWTESVRNEMGYAISITNKDGTYSYTSYYNEFGQLIRWEEKSGAFYCEIEYDAEGRICKETRFGQENQIFAEYEFVYSFFDQVETVNLKKNDGSYYTSFYSVFDITGRMFMQVGFEEDGSFNNTTLYLYSIFDPSKGICLDSKAEPRVIPGLMPDQDTAGVETEAASVVTSGIKKPSYADYADALENYGANGVKLYETVQHKKPEHPELEMLKEFKLMKTGSDGNAYMSTFFADYKDVNAAIDDNYTYYGWATPRTGAGYKTYTQGWTENQEYQYYEIETDSGYILSYLLDDVVLTVSCYPELKEDARAIMFNILTGN